MGMDWYKLSTNAHNCSLLMTRMEAGFVNGWIDEKAWMFVFLYHERHLVFLMVFTFKNSDILKE